MKIGIIGGGQLAKMMTQEAKKMGFYVEILDPTPESPAWQVADKQIVGSFHDANKLREIAERNDVITYDIEHVNTEALKKLFDEGHKLYPSPYLLEIIQDKLKQRDILYKNDIPVPKYEKMGEFNLSCLEKVSFPLVQKTLKDGYDGRGVVILKSKNDLGKMIKGDSLVEEFIDFEKEIAIMVARSIKGDIKCYPVVEMIFDDRANICDMVIAPARIERTTEKQVMEIATKVIEVFDGVGIFGIEMFLTKEGKVLVNEVAPRPHNSGHYTIEACVTCQFEQHIRAITGLPLGSTDLLSPAVMINLLGEEKYEGPPIIEGLDKALSIPGLSFHFYGKKVTYPFRKMGHVTILDKNIKLAIEKAMSVKTLLKIRG